MSTSVGAGAGAFRADERDRVDRFALVPARFLVRAPAAFFAGRFSGVVAIDPTVSDPSAASVAVPGVRSASMSRDAPAPAVVAAAADLDALSRLVVACRACPRLVRWREKVAREKRAAYRDEEYWGRPVPGFGDPEAHLLVVGLAPAAHGANRTGRMFTGDRSGDFLFAALHRAGYASQPEAVARNDGLRLRGAYITAPVRCAPPQNKPTAEERADCRPFLQRELELLPAVRVVLALGRIGYVAAMQELGEGPRPKFGHGVEVPLSCDRTLLCSYHVSQQNTFTGRLTESMFDEVLTRARRLGQA